MAHGHDHHHSAAHASQRRLAVVLAITAAVLVGEVVGGLMTGSLALLADAGHLFIDAVAITTILAAVLIGGRPPDAARTFGYARWEVIASALNAVLLLVVAGGVMVEAITRLVEPAPVAYGPMLVVAMIGLLANAVALAILRASDRDSIAMRAARLELLADLAGSIAVVVAAIVIGGTGWTGADVVASVLVVLLIVPRSIWLLREASAVLLEATPSRMDLAEVRRHLSETPGVRDVHDLHAWAITSGFEVMTAHVVVHSDVTLNRVLDDLQSCAATDFAIEHATFQLEVGGECAGVHP